MKSSVSFTSTIASTVDSGKRLLASIFRSNGLSTFKVRSCDKVLDPTPLQASGTRHQHLLEVSFRIGDAQALEALKAVWLAEIRELESMSQAEPRRLVVWSTQRGTVTLQTLAATLLFALTLGALGPAIDAEPYGTPLPPIDAGEIARFEAEARALCRGRGGDNTGYIATADGGVICTDKHGRHHRSAP